ncbi:MAG: divalent-cation tolerance protein CutA [Gemmatimonadales bacterium]|nr:divalent-cation tolerance protein CutA [Gemmatimonadales bacterium]
MAAAVVSARLAACAQVLGPVASTYWWKGAVERGAEWLCVMKTADARLPALMKQIRSLHPYDQPEIVATPIVAGDPGYLDWILTESEPSP